MTNDDRIRLAREIAVTMTDKGMNGPEGLTVLAMAMGIYMEAQPGTLPFEPAADVVCTVAKLTFNALRAHRDKTGHA